MKKFFLFSCFILLISAFLTACGEDSSKQANITAKDNNQLTVYTTVYPLQYFTEAIGGDSVVVETIYPPGSDEHTFDPSQQDMIALADSDLFFYVGLGLEGFVDKAKSSLQNEEVTLVATGDSLLATEAFATLQNIVKNIMKTITKHTQLMMDITMGTLIHMYGLTLYMQKKWPIPLKML